MTSMTRRDFNRTIATGMVGTAMAGTGLVSLEGLASQVSGEKRPNFVFICADQHSAKYTGFAGHPFVKTPNLDRLAAGGVAFSSAYCGSPLCVPGRSSMMTGMYASDVNSFCNSTVHDDSHPTWGKMLRDSGYYCWATGKQDLNPGCDLGFVEAEVENGHARKPDITSLFRRPVGYRIAEREGIDGEAHDPRKFEGKKSKDMLISDRDDRCVNFTLDFLKNTSARLGKPWAAFVGFRAPHPPWNGLRAYFDEYLQKVEAPRVSIEDLERLPLPYQAMRNFKRISTPIPDDRMKRAVAAYLAMITELDGKVGEVYRCLEETRQLDNTYVMYTSDHGESLGEHGMWLKSNLYEGPAHIPLLISGPGLPKGKTIDAPVGHVDLVATMLHLSGTQQPKGLRGTSFLPLIDGKEGEGPSFAYSESHSEGNPTGSCMIRKGNWKLLHFSYYEDCLFDLKNDPNETQNRINDPAVQDVAADLRATLYRTVDPEEVTERAFALQEKMLKHFAESMNEEELFQMLNSRLGDGQARVMAKMLRSKYQ